MNAFDGAALAFVNQFSQRSWRFDHLIGFLSTDAVLKGGAIAAIVWWVWAQDSARETRIREGVIATLVGSVVAMSLARLLVVILPFRARPIHDSTLDFLVPLGTWGRPGTTWSSFPSDHAVLFLALSTGLMFAHRRAGLLALLYSTVVICLPRLYLGLHFATDLIAGAVLGMMVAAAVNLLLVTHPLVRAGADWSYARPGPAHVLLFIATLEIANLFDSTREMARVAFHLVAPLFR